MTEARLDLDALVAALDAKRKVKRFSWRKLAQEAGVSPSTLTRMHQGKRPDVNTFSGLVRWLGLPAENFMVAEGKKLRKAAEPHPLVVASTLLRGKKEMSPKAVNALEELVRAAYNFVKEMK